MKPVVPKIRVGNVLYGTKNLRNYLRTASLIRYFINLRNYHARTPQSTNAIYSPRKNDIFVVAANTHNRFCVWSPNKEVILLFVNLSLSKNKVPIPSEEKMNPQIFASWFSKTQHRLPALNTWPVWGQYLWGSLQMNACSNPILPLALDYPGIALNRGVGEIPFLLKSKAIPANYDTTTIQHAVRESIQGGYFRNDPPRQITHAKFASLSPSLQDLPHMFNLLNELTSNPQTLAQAKKDEDKGLNYQFILNIKNDSL